MAEHLYAGGRPRPAGRAAVDTGPGRPTDGASPNGGDGPKPEDVIDVEFEEKK